MLGCFLFYRVYGRVREYGYILVFLFITMGRVVMFGAWGNGEMWDFVSIVWVKDIKVGKVENE